MNKKVSNSKTSQKQKKSKHKNIALKFECLTKGLNRNYSLCLIMYHIYWDKPEALVFFFSYDALL